MKNFLYKAYKWSNSWTGTIVIVLFVIFLGFIYVNFPSFRIDQAFKFLIFVPIHLALTSLILVILSVKGLI